MADRPNPSFVTSEEIILVGTMAVYDSQAAASDGIPQQWRAFLQSHPELPGDTVFYGASPCTGDHKIHYLTGIEQTSTSGTLVGERLTLTTGEYAFVRVEEPAQLRDTWVWLLNQWLTNSGRRERNAPEFERFSSISEEGIPKGVEVWIPLEPLEENVG